MPDDVKPLDEAAIRELRPLMFAITMRLMSSFGDGVPGLRQPRTFLPAKECDELAGALEHAAARVRGDLAPGQTMNRDLFRRWLRELLDEALRAATAAAEDDGPNVVAFIAFVAQVAGLTRDQVAALLYSLDGGT